MIKEITVSVPHYVKKFILSEPDYEAVSPTRIKVPRKSELGQIIYGLSRTIPTTEPVTKPVENKATSLITLRYTCKKKAFDIPEKRYPALVAILVEIFRSSLIREVAAIHELHCEDDYGWIVRSFLQRRGVIVDDGLDKDIEWETAKKIYRDHLSRIQKKNASNRKLSQPVLSGLQTFCPA